MKNNSIKSLKLLQSRSVITAISISESNKEYTFIVMNIHHRESGLTKLNIIEIDEQFTTWEMTLPTACDEEKVFTSPNDPKFAFKIFPTKHTCKELGNVLMRYLKSTTP